MSQQQQSLLSQALPNDQSNNTQRAANDLRSRGHQNGQSQHLNGSASQNGVAVPVPRGPTNGHGNSGSVNGQAFAGARSPPNAKNTSHVPCKFYKQGACQAGNSCPYSHAESIGPCKYFQKGNCKFGMRCANEHILPDGVRVQKQNHMNMASQMAHGGRGLPQMPTQPYSMQQDQFNSGAPQNFALPAPIGPGYDMHPPYTMFDGFPMEARNQTSHEDGLGSPPQDYHMGRSPPNSRLSVLDAPLPASFDSQGISHIARYGPIAASVPARLGGFESSSPASSASRIDDTGNQSSALRNLQFSAFGDGAKHMLSFSPPGNEVPPQRMGMRSMRSATYSRPKVLSSSVGNNVLSRRYNGDDDDGDDYRFESIMFEDALPNALNELLTPQERLRRHSRTADDESVSNHRAALLGIGTPLGESPKVGSPGGLGVSPSRYGSLFQRQQREKSEATLNETVTNAFGHVGSPLRSSHLNSGSSPSLRASSGRPASGDFSMSSPPRQASGSLITQHLQRSRLSGRADSSESTATLSTLQHPGVQRVASGSAPVPPNRLDRSISTTSSTGIGREKIEEEDELFAMEGLNLSGDKAKRTSAGSSVWADVARSGAAKSYATSGRRIVSGPSNGTSNGTTNGS